MKGTIVKCLEEMVVEQFGLAEWEASLQDAGLDKSTVFWPMADIDDAQVMKLVKIVCGHLGISFIQAADAFGDYWVNVYSQKMYPLYYEKSKTAKEFLLDLDNLHVELTRTMQNARPPRFTYEWINDKTLIMHYRSHRNLVDFVVGFARGVGKHYGENLQISKVGPDRVMIIFD
ncbi:MAG: hypothetical protein GY847_06315 [Proteobacteria bacterium]|nr:hypothetical protein [Pseudomonadota bacterium]